jgi:hypothetical protein
MAEGGVTPASGGAADLEHVAAEDDVAGMDALHALVLEDLCDDVLGGDEPRQGGAAELLRRVRRA